MNKIIANLRRRYRDIKRRCFNPKCSHFYKYGGQGISMCDEWRDSFEAFRDWSLANGFTIDKQIDRIDPSGDYRPENCRWATTTQQAINTRARRGCISKYKGVCRERHGWRARTTKNGRRYDAGFFESEIEAARAYDAAVREIYGEFAWLNFPDESSLNQV